MNLRFVPRDLRPAVKEACGRGWTCHRSLHGHIRMWKEGSGAVYLPCSPSDWRGIRNAKALLKRKGAIG